MTDLTNMMIKELDYQAYNRKLEQIRYVQQSKIGQDSIHLQQYRKIKNVKNLDRQFRENITQNNIRQENEKLMAKVMGIYVELLDSKKKIREHSRNDEYLVKQTSSLRARQNQSQKIQHENMRIMDKIVNVKPSYKIEFQIKDFQKNHKKQVQLLQKSQIKTQIRKYNLVQSQIFNGKYYNPMTQLQQKYYGASNLNLSLPEISEKSPINGNTVRVTRANNSVDIHNKISVKNSIEKKSKSQCRIRDPSSINDLSQPGNKFTRIQYRSLSQQYPSKIKQQDSKTPDTTQQLIEQQNLDFNDSNNLITN